MIKVYDFLWQRLIDYGKKFQSGQDTVDEFNSRLAEVQLEVFNDISPMYQVNEMVRALMEPWTREKVSSSGSTGIIARPTDNDETFARALSLGVVDDAGEFLFEISQYTEGELAIAQRIPQRRPSIANKIVVFIPNNKVIKLYPRQLIKYSMFYLIYPKLAKIAFTVTQTDDEDVMTIDSGNTVDLLWDENASNIILYKMLEKYGIVNREMMLAQYAKLGINTTMGGTNVNG